MAHDLPNISLPISIVSPTDIARLTRELEAVDNFFRDSSIRQPGAPTAMPRLSKLMDQLVTDNQLNLLQGTDRAKIGTVLETLHEGAPVMHMSFSVDPPGPYVQKIVAWMRKNIHPQILVTVGLQPNIGAGCVVRTTNKLFDFSLREFFSQKREFFIEKLHTAIADPGEVVDAPLGQPTRAPEPSPAEPVKPPEAVAEEPVAPAPEEAAPEPAPESVTAEQPTVEPPQPKPEVI